MEQKTRALYNVARTCDIVRLSCFVAINQSLKRSHDDTKSFNVFEQETYPRPTQKYGMLYRVLCIVSIRRRNELALMTSVDTSHITNWYQTVLALAIPYIK